MVLTIISIGLLVVIAFPTIPAIFKLSEMPSIQGNDPALVVTVRGYQWWWSFTYENASKKVVTANELRIPVGRKVLLRLESVDVIHSFWVPKLAGKTDVIPNQHNEMWLEADQQGQYYGQCAEYCGTSHANMRFRVITMYPKEFEAWIREQDQPALTPPAGSLAAEGMRIFMKGPKEGQACSTCHQIKGTDAVGLVGPNLTHFASRQTMGAAIMDNNLADVEKWLHNPGEVKPGNKMATTAVPPLNLTNAEVQALAAYLESLK
jgi:cytochrome c oxidase subunit 2